MAKELRVYIIDTNKIPDNKLYTQPIYTADDEQFITLSEMYGDVYSLKGFEDAVSLGAIDLSSHYLKFIKI
jgi:hypothetical protein